MAPAGNLKRVLTGKSGQNRKKKFGRVMYASETIQNCKNPTGHIDTLRECPDLIAESLTYIFNQSLLTGIFPDEWKSARVTPLYKNSGKRNDPTNYRPISVIPVVAKVFERVVYDQLYYYLTKNCILSRYQSGFRSLHCCVVWGNCGSGLSEKLQKLQNRAARILMHASYDSNIDELFRALGWRKLKYQRSESAAVMMYKSLHGMTPEYLTSRFVFRNDITSYRLRNTENKLALPQPRTNYLKKSFSYSGAGLWNSLSGNLRAATSLNNFKLNLRYHSFECVLTRHPCKAAFSM